MAIDYSFPTFERLRRHVSSLSAMQREDETQRVKKQLVDSFGDFDYPVVGSNVSAKLYYSMLEGGENFLFDVERIEDRLGLNSDSTELIQHLHSLFMHTRGNVNQAAEVEKIDPNELSDLLRDEEFFPDNYSWLPWVEDPIEELGEEERLRRELGLHTYFARLKRSLTLPHSSDARNEFLGLYLYLVKKRYTDDNGRFNLSKTAEAIGVSRFGFQKMRERVDISPRQDHFAINPLWNDELPNYKGAMVQFNLLYAHYALLLGRGSVSKISRMVRMSRFGVQKRIKNSGLDPKDYKLLDA